MKIELKEVSIKEVSEGYVNDEEEGVVGFKGKLNIRPKYQREFVYKDKQRDAVIETVRKNFPLNVMYWVKNEDGTYEVMDGQQRTISFCEYIAGKFSLNFQYFHNLEDDEKEQILNYKLMVYSCEGTDKENLETTISWISNGEIEEYMAKNQHKPNANELWLYFQSVLNWTKAVFPKYRKEMRDVDFGILYNKFKDKEFDSKKIEKEITKLMQDDDVTKKSGIYVYVLTRNEKYLNIRAFTDNQKREAYERQKGICPKCKKHFEIEETEADHITPWHEGGKTTSENCQILRKQDNRIKSGI